jgi:hypothetical protein
LHPLAVAGSSRLGDLAQQAGAELGRDGDGVRLTSPSTLPPNSTSWISMSLLSLAKICITAFENTFQEVKEVLLLNC